MGIALLTETTWLLGSGQTLSVLRYDVHGNFLDQFVQFSLSDPQPGYCYGLALDDQGAIFIMDFWANVWVVLTGRATSDPIQLLAPGLGPLTTPTCITAGPAGPERNLYIACGDSKIRRYALGFQSVSVPLAATPNGLTGNHSDATFLDLGVAGINGAVGGLEFGPDGNLYVSAGDIVYVYGIDGTQLRSFATSNTGVIRFGSDGLLYMLVYGGGDLSSIQRFDPQLGIPFGVDGPADSAVVPYGTPQLIGSSDFRIVKTPNGDLQAFVTTWYQLPAGQLNVDGSTVDLSGGGIVTFDMATGSFVANFVPNNAGGAFQPYALICAQTAVPGITLPNGTYQIICADFASDDDGNEYIGTVGGSVGGAIWRLAVEEAIAGIKAGNWSSYTLANGIRANVLIGVSASGYEYLTTTPDSTTANNLDVIAQTQSCS